MEIKSCIITLSTICQLSCPTCRAGGLRNNYPNVKTGFMTRDTLVNIMKKVPFHNCNYHNWGEPFLHKQLVEFIKIGKSYGKRIEIHTNMQIMTADIARNIVESGLDILYISCDGVTQEAYEKYRVGGKLQKLTENASLLASVKSQLESLTPQIIWKMVVNKFNQHQADDFVEFAENHGADRALCADMYSQTPEGWFEIDKYATTDERWKAVKVLGTVEKCKEPFQRFSIDWNGDVYTCCNPTGIEVYKMGNINEQTFDEIWHGEKYQYARRFCESGEPEDNGHILQCHACFNKFPNKSLREQDMWAPCLDVMEKQNG